MNFDKDKDTCPQCGKKGRKVNIITIELQLAGEGRGALDNLEGFRFCLGKKRV